MKTLYDLLGAHPDDDAERLRNAFRKAAKANHPDVHAGDRDAPRRFRQIVEAYDILRDAELRATYDQRLAFEREQLLSKSKRAISYFMYIAFDGVVVVGLASVLVGGYTIFAHIPKAPVQELAGITARGPASTAGVQPAERTALIEPNELRDKLGRVAVPDTAIVPSVARPAATYGGAQQVARGAPAPASAGLYTEIAKPNVASDVRIDHATAKTSANHPEKTSSPQRIPKITIPGRSRIVVKREAASRTPFKQASLESRNTSGCSEYPSCRGDLPPLFGVGF